MNYFVYMLKSIDNKYSKTYVGYTLNLKKRLQMQKNIEVKFEPISNANHFYKGLPLFFVSNPAYHRL